MANNRQLRELSKARLKIAKILFEKEDYNGVIDNVGFALELALKAVICRKLALENYPDEITDRMSKQEKTIANIFRTHDFSTLLVLSGLSKKFEFSPSNPRKLILNWGYITTTWSTEVRYEPIGTYDRSVAEEIYKAAIDDQHGVITFIKKKKRW